MPLVALAYLAFAAGLLLGFGGEVFLGSAAALGVAVAAWLRRSLGLAGLALAGTAGLALSAAAQRSDDRCRRAAVLATEWRVRLRDAAGPGASARGTSRTSGCVVRVTLFVRDGQAPIGAQVLVRGLAARSTRGLLVRQATVVQTGAPSPLGRLRGAAAAAIDRNFPRDAPLVRALLIADTRSLTPELRDRFAAAGLVHLLSISGLHVGIIAMAAQLLFRAVGLRPRLAAAASVLGTGIYVLVIGAPAPALRAGAMLAVMASSRAFQRPTSPWASLAIGALVPLTNPRVVLDLGYQLSVTGIAGLIGARSASMRWVAPRVEGWRYGVIRDLMASTLATVVTAPLIAWTFGRVSVVGPIMNLAAGPLMAFLQPALFLSLLCAPVPVAARFVADATHPLLVALDAIASIGASLPAATVSVAPSLGTAALCAIAAGALVAACTSRVPWRAVTTGVAALAAIAWAPILPSPPGRTELHLIDVGQGDALALRTPRGRWVLFDAGGSWRGGDAGRATVIPYVRRRGGAIAALVLSHPHTDHVGGAASVLRALRPQEYWDAAFVGPAESYLASLEAARDAGTRWRRAHPGDSVVIDGLRIDFLAPDSAWIQTLTDPNEASTVALVRYGAVRFLLVGDAERREEAWLLARWADALRADVLKVGHHGSATSSTPEFIQTVRPRVALISVGAGNRYGHPSPEVVRLLARAGADVLRSDELGSIVARTDGIRIEIEAGGERWAASPP